MNATTQPRCKRALTLSLCLLMVAACSSETSENKASLAPNDATSAPATNMAQHSGVLNTKQGVFHFTPQTCVFHKENGVDDIEIGGPGQAPDGEKFYFELTSTGNEATIELGVDTPYQSSDRKLVAGQHVSEPFTLDVAGKTLSISKLVLVDSRSGQQVDDSASLKIDCAR